MKGETSQAAFHVIGTMRRVEERAAKAVKIGGLA